MPTSLTGSLELPRLAGIDAAQPHQPQPSALSEAVRRSSALLEASRSASPEAAASHAELPPAADHSSQPRKDSADSCSAIVPATGAVGLWPQLRLAELNTDLSQPPGEFRACEILPVKDEILPCLWVVCPRASCLCFSPFLITA